MNILIYLPNFGPIGGIERHIINTTSLLARHGCAVTLLTIENRMALPDRTHLSSMGVRLIEAAVRSRGRTGRAYSLVREALRLRRHSTFDIIYTNAVGLSHPVVWLNSLANHTRVIHHHHNSADPDEQRTWPTGYPFLLKHAPELIVCSYHTADNIRALGRKRDMQVLYYLTNDLRPAAGHVGATTPRTGKLAFGFFGRVTNSKGLKWIVELSKRQEFRDVEFHINGLGTDVTDSFFTCFPNVRYFGPYFTASEQATRLHAVDCVILPSTHFEGMPLSLLEAMSYGKPWVATDRGGVRELAVSDQYCLVTSPTFEGFTGGVLRMMTTLRTQRSIGAELQQLYQAKFDLRASQRAWLSLFRVAPGQVGCTISSRGNVHG